MGGNPPALLVGRPVISALHLVVVPSPQSNDHAVHCLADGANILETLGGLGLDPDDFFSFPVAIAAGTPREARIGRCECGTVGCGDLVILIAREGEQVVWEAKGREIRFDAAQYDAEIARAATDLTWETGERTAARLVRERLPVEELRARGLALDGASGSALSGRFTLSLHPTKGAYKQILLDVPWVDDAEEVATAALERLEDHLAGPWRTLARRLLRRFRL